jgi:4a-hydroxytetrahydrobiopterin dehydratase
MARPEKLSNDDVTKWMTAHAGWERKGEALVRKYAFKDFGDALAFVVRVGMFAEKHDHHPDIELGWGKAQLLWSTHDAGGITSLDTKLAEASDSVYYAPK